MKAGWKRRLLRHLIAVVIVGALVVAAIYLGLLSEAPPLLAPGIK
jgi:hypothetical protein